MTIQLNEVATQITATERKSKLATASWARAGVIFYAPDGNVFQIPKGYDVLGEVQQQATQKNLLNSALADEYVGNFEKDAAFKLREKNGWKFQGRQPRGDNAVPEWDHFCLSVTGSDVEDFDKIKEVFVKELQSANVLSRLRSNDQGDGKPVETQLGIEGKRPIFISEEHDNTGARHVHFFVGRLAFDHNKKEISKAIVIGNAGIKASIREGIQAGLIEAGLDASRFTFAGTVGSQGTDAAAAQQLTSTLLESEAEEEALGPLEAPTPESVEGSELDDQVAPTQEAAAKAPAPEVPTTLPAGALLAKLERARGDKHEKVERLSKEYLRKLNEAKEEAQELKMMDLAIAAVRQEEAMKSQLSTAQGALAKANTDLEALDAVQKTAAGVFLEKSMALDLTDEQRGALRSEDAATRNSELVNVIQSTVTFSVGWKEALEVIGELGHTEVQEKLLEDPSAALEEVVEAASRVPALNVQVQTLDAQVQDREQALQNANDQFKALSDAVQAMANAVPIDAELKQTLLDDPAKGLVGLAEAFRGLKTDLSNQQIRHEGAVDALTTQHAKERTAMEQAHAKAVELSQAEITRLTEERDQALEEAASLRNTLKDVSKQLDVYLELAPTADDDKHFSSDEMKLKVLGKLAELQEKREELNADLTEKNIEIESLGEQIKAAAVGSVINYSNGKSDDVKALRTTYEQLAANHLDGVAKGYIPADEKEPETPLERTETALSLQAKRTDLIDGTAKRSKLTIEKAAGVVDLVENAKATVGEELMDALLNGLENKTSSLLPRQLIAAIESNPDAFLKLASNLAQNLDDLADIPEQGLTPPQPYSGTDYQPRSLGNEGNDGPKPPGIDDDEDLTRGR